MKILQVLENSAKCDFKSFANSMLNLGKIGLHKKYMLTNKNKCKQQNISDLWLFFDRVISTPRLT